MIRFKLFGGVDEPLEIYNGKAIIDMEIQFFVDECEADEIEEEDYVFVNYVSSYLRVYDERLGRLLKTIPLSQSGNSLIVNTQDANYDVNGNYWYEIGYVSGGYEVALKYGILKVV